MLFQWPNYMSIKDSCLMFDVSAALYNYHMFNILNADGDMEEDNWDNWEEERISCYRHWGMMSKWKGSNVDIDIEGWCQNGKVATLI